MIELPLTETAIQNEFWIVLGIALLLLSPALYYLSKDTEKKSLGKIVAQILGVIGLASLVFGAITPFFFNKPLHLEGTEYKVTSDQVEKAIKENYAITEIEGLPSSFSNSGMMIKWQSASSDYPMGEMEDLTLKDTAGNTWEYCDTYVTSPRIQEGAAVIDLDLVCENNKTPLPKN